MDIWLYERWNINVGFIEKKSKAKQRIVRAERLIKKLRQDMETLQEETAMLPALVKVKNSSQ